MGGAARCGSGGTNLWTWLPACPVAGPCCLRGQPTCSPSMRMPSRSSSSFSWTIEATASARGDRRGAWLSLASRGSAHVCSGGGQNGGWKEGRYACRAAEQAVVAGQARRPCCQPRPPTLDASLQTAQHSTARRDAHPALPARVGCRKANTSSMLKNRAAAVAPRSRVSAGQGKGLMDRASDSRGGEAAATPVSQLASSPALVPVSVRTKPSPACATAAAPARPAGCGPLAELAA